MIFFKIIISTVILCITSYMGIELAVALKMREEILTDCVTFLKMLKNEMTYMSDSLPTCFERARQSINSRFKDVIGAIVVDMSRFGIEKVDSRIVNNVDELDQLTDYDKEIIISTLKNLGRSDIMSQNNIIENSIGIIENQIKEASEKNKKSSKVYKTIGVISGLIIIVIFI